MSQMSELRALEKAIRQRRAAGEPFLDVDGLPQTPGTVNNLRIYFASHVSIDGEIANSIRDSDTYGVEEQALELTELGSEIVQSVLDREWPAWGQANAAAPTATQYAGIAGYFAEGVGQACPDAVITEDAKRERKALKKAAKGVLEQGDVDGLRDLPKRQFEEGKRHLVKHESIEKTRNPALVREAKRLFKHEQGHLYCQACGFDFEQVYGDRGKEYIEAHHRMPIGALQETVTLTVQDLAMLCANCHRVLHRPPWITVEELQAIVTAARAGVKGANVCIGSWRGSQRGHPP